MAQRKLGRPADQRKALLRNQVTSLLWHGRIETTVTRAKEVRRIADKMVTLAVREYDNSVQIFRSPRRRTRARATTGSAPRITSIPWWRSFSANTAPSTVPAIRKRILPVAIPAFPA